jgi:hypothetical protein
MVICRVCGLLDEDDVYEPNFICCCCYAQTTLDDDNLETVRAYRAEWKKRGYPWIGDREDMKMYDINPKTWDPLEQMKNIPPEWR